MIGTTSRRVFICAAFVLAGSDAQALSYQQIVAASPEDHEATLSAGSLTDEVVVRVTWRDVPGLRPSTHTLSVLAEYDVVAGPWGADRLPDRSFLMARFRRLRPAGRSRSDVEARRMNPAASRIASASEVFQSDCTAVPCEDLYGVSVGAVSFPPEFTIHLRMSVEVRVDFMRRRPKDLPDDGVAIEFVRDSPLAEPGCIPDATVVTSCAGRIEPKRSVAAQFGHGGLQLLLVACCLVPLAPIIAVAVLFGAKVGVP